MLTLFILLVIMIVAILFLPDDFKNMPRRYELVEGEIVDVTYKFKPKYKFVKPGEYKRIR